jgi:hypothetical protein
VHSVSAQTPAALHWPPEILNIVQTERPFFRVDNLFPWFKENSFWGFSNNRNSLLAPACWENKCSEK